MKTPFYVDPATGNWPTPNLIAGLIAAPTTEKLSPLERQVTIVLAWLLHHSRVFARATAELFFAGDEEALAALDERVTVGARAWGTLRKIEGITGAIYPDLTITGSGRSFDLIVEIKIDAGLHSWDLPDGSRLYQPDAYVRAWMNNYDATGEAKVRRVGTLTKTGSAVGHAASGHRAADVRWTDLRDLLGRLLRAGTIEREAMAVALDAAAAIDQRILAVRVPAHIDDPAIAWGYSLLTDLAPAVASELPGGSLKLGAAVQTDYAGAYVYFESPYGPQRMWLYATPREGKYNAPGWESSLWIAEVDAWPNPLKEAAARTGIPNVKDKAGYTAYRLGLAMADVQRAGDHRAQLSYILEEAAPFLAALRNACA